MTTSNKICTSEITSERDVTCEDKIIPTPPLKTQQTKYGPFTQFIDSKRSFLLLHLLNGLLLVFALLLSIGARLGLALQDLLAVLVQL